MKWWLRIKNHGILLLILLSMSLNLVLGFLLFRVNDDLDYLYSKVGIQGKTISQVMETQKYMISSREAQRLLDQQSATYQSQINDLNGAINGAYYQMDQNQQKAQNAYNQRQMEAGIKYSR